MEATLPLSLCMLVRLPAHQLLVLHPTPSLKSALMTKLLMIQACIWFYCHYAKPWPVFLSAQLAALSVCMCSVSIPCVLAAANALCISALHSAGSPLPPPHANSAAPPLSMCRKSSLQCVCVCACAQHG